jgi:ankyrin repeat protein
MLRILVAMGFVAVFRYVIDKGATPTTRMMFTACRNGHIEIVRECLRLNIHNEEDRLNTNGHAMRSAAEKGHSAIVKLLLDHNTSSAGVLEKAAYYGRREIVQLLLDHGVESQESLYVAIEHATALEHDTLLDILLERSMKTWPAPDVFFV